MSDPSQVLAELIKRGKITELDIHEVSGYPEEFKLLTSVVMQMLGTAAEAEEYHTEATLPNEWERPQHKQWVKLTYWLIQRYKTDVLGLQQTLAQAVGLYRKTPPPVREVLWWLLDRNMFEVATIELRPPHSKPSPDEPER